MRYIIGLIPLESKNYCQIAQNLFSDISDGYLLSKTVFPHITLTQFESDDTQLAESFWETIQEFKVAPFMPELIGIGLVKGRNEHKNFYWAQVTVERSPYIMALHFKLLDLLKKHHLNSLVDSGEIYKPHITLSRIQLCKPIPLWPDSILEPGLFKLTIGASDQNGRYLKTIYE